MFNKFHLTFNFKSKVSHEVFGNKKRMSIDIYILFHNCDVTCLVVCAN